MSKELRAMTPTGEHVTKIEVDGRRNFSAGGFEKKGLVFGRINGHEITMIERISNPEIYLRVWKEAKEVGLPVVPTARVNLDDNTLLITDLKADGGEIYGKSLRVLYGEFRYFDSEAWEDYRRNRENDDAFLTLMEPDNFLKVKERIHFYVQLANKHQFILPTEGPFELLIQPDGRWRIIMLDLWFGGLLRTREEFFKDRLAGRSVEQSNEYAVSLFERDLQVLVSNIKREREEMGEWDDNMEA